MDSLIPPSKISTLTQGIFVGAVSDNIDQRIDQKIFHAEIVVDSKKVDAEMKKYVPIPILTDFKDASEDKHKMKADIQANYDQIKQDVRDVVDNEIARIDADPKLRHLLQQKGWKHQSKFIDDK